VKAILDYSIEIPKEKMMINGKDITLRPLQEQDLSVFFSLLGSLPLISEFIFKDLISEFKFKKEFEKTGFWEDEKGIIAILKDDKIVGAIFFEPCYPMEALELRFCIFDEKDRGQGYMQQGLKLFSAYLFATKKIQRLQLFIPDYHKASIAVSKKCGFIFEGIARRALFFKGKYIDLCMYSQLRDECKNIAKL